MNYSAIDIQGNIISSELIDRLRSEDLNYQDPESFGLERGDAVRDHIGEAWSLAKTYWQSYRLKIENLKEGEYGTSETRKLFVIPLLMELGYDPDTSTAEMVEGRDRPYAISHRDSSRDGLPILIMGYHDELDKKPKGGRLSMSPHALMQDYLNHTEHLYGLVSNGRFIRLLRDSYKLARLSYLEFDLEQIMEEELYAEFAILYRLLHASRLPQDQNSVDECIIEGYHQDSMEFGSRIRGALRKRVKEAMELLANGFLEHPVNEELRQRVQEEELRPEAFYRLLLRVMYRFIFLATMEERGLIFPIDESDDEAKDRTQRFREIYYRYYSLERLRNLCLASIYVDPSKSDLYQALMDSFQLFEPIKKGDKMGIQPLGGTLFGSMSLQEEGYDLYQYKLKNKHLLDIVNKLSTFTNEQGQLARIRYHDLTDELGSIYEALLELHPYFQVQGDTVHFAFSESSERKLTGSYYTREDLVAQLIKTALIPVMQERLNAFGNDQIKEKEAALLSLKVCDPAAGSGHFLIAAARVLAFELARLRSGEENPGERYVREAKRDVIQKCIYGVDKNPAAVELCRMSLWLESHDQGKPLTFLDHKIQHGDSLLGLGDLKMLEQGIPNEAFKPLTGDERKVANAWKANNRAFLQTKQIDIFNQAQRMADRRAEQAEKFRAVDAQEVETVADYEAKEKAYRKLKVDADLQKSHTACNLYTYAFFQPLIEEGTGKETVVTSEHLFGLIRSAGSSYAQHEAKANAAALKYDFFHWPLVFPDVAQQGGFDVMLGNPPWERIKLQEKEFFLGKSEPITSAPNAAARKRLIKALPETDPELFEEYMEALRTSEGSSLFIRDSGGYPLTGRGDINLYSIFSELSSQKVRNNGRGGILVPTGIATDDTNKYFFASLVEQERLVSLFDFENKKGLFENVHRMYKFCMLTMGKAQGNAHFAFFLHDVLDLQDERRTFTLSKQDFLNINPNTKTCPIFRTRQDAELTKKIYSRIPVLINEEKNQNPWGISFMRMFDMSNDSHLFRTREQLEAEGFRLMGNRFVKGKAAFSGSDGEMWLPLYESKLIWHYDHRYGSYEGVESRTSTQMPDTSLERYQDASHVIQPWYWVNSENVSDQSEDNFFFGFRDITNATNERTVISNVISKSAVSNKMPLLLGRGGSISQLAHHIELSSMPFDFVARQKIGGTSLNFFLFKQLTQLSDASLSNSDLAFAFELIYSSWDIKAFADELWQEADEELRTAITQQWEENKAATGGHTWEIPEWHEAYPEIAWEKDKGCPLPPLKWDEERRAYLKAELDARFALLYGLERDEMRYILDPQDVHGEDFPGETFRVLKDREIRTLGEYRTRRLVLEAYDRLRPNWDMEAHLQLLKEEWEKCQVDLSEEKEDKKKTKLKNVMEEDSVQYGLFGGEGEAMN